MDKKFYEIFKERLNLNGYHVSLDESFGDVDVYNDNCYVRFNIEYCNSSDIPKLLFNHKKGSYTDGIAPPQKYLDFYTSIECVVRKIKIEILLNV